VVLLLDVLEHLHDPLATLRAASARLAPGGKVIVSVPNVTHCALALQLLQGKFQYTEQGLLDRTHLHLFDRAALEALLADANLTVLDRMRTERGMTQTEIPIDPAEFPDAVLDLARAGEDADTYQFVYVATVGPQQPNSHPALLGETLQRRLSEITRTYTELEAYTRSLEARVSQSEQAGERVTWLEEELARRVKELESGYEQLRYAKLDLAVKDEQLAELQAELAPIRERLDRLEQTLGYARHRIVDKLSGYSKRVPALHRLLKRLTERIAYRQP
jgi:hypothetical protein